MLVSTSKEEMETFVSLECDGLVDLFSLVALTLNNFSEFSPKLPGEKVRNKNVQVREV
jgi:hypothetical protein